MTDDDTSLIVGSTHRDYHNLQNKEEGKSSDVEVPLPSAFLEETVQFGIKSDTMITHWVISILQHCTNRICISCNMIKYMYYSFIHNTCTHIALVMVRELVYRSN